MELFFHPYFLLTYPLKVHETVGSGYHGVFIGWNQVAWILNRDQRPSNLLKGILAKQQKNSRRFRSWLDIPWSSHFQRLLLLVLGIFRVYFPGFQKMPNGWMGMVKFNHFHPFPIRKELFHHPMDIPWSWSQVDTQRRSPWDFFPSPENY